MIKRIILIKNRTYFYHQCGCCGKEWAEPNTFKKENKENETSHDTKQNREQN